MCRRESNRNTMNKTTKGEGGGGSKMGGGTEMGRSGGARVRPPRTLVGVYISGS